MTSFSMEHKLSPIKNRPQTIFNEVKLYGNNNLNIPFQSQRAHPPKTRLKNANVSPSSN